MSLRTLVTIRWIAIAGQALTLLIVHKIMGFTLPLEIALGVVGASVVINLVNSLQRPGSVRLDDHDLMLHLAYDIVQVAGDLWGARSFHERMLRVYETGDKIFLVGFSRGGVAGIFAGIANRFADRSVRYQANSLAAGDKR